MKSKFFPALAVLVGTTIGAGFLGIPYVVAKSGVFPGFAYLVFIFLFILLVKLYLGEVSLRTNGNHQLTGYASRYLGRWGKRLMFVAMILGVYSALLAYLIGEGKSISYIIFGNFNYAFLFSLTFWFVMLFLTYIGLKALKKYEKIGMILVLSIVFLILFFFFKGIKLENLNYISKEHLFMPFGVIVFSFLAFSAMPEVERILSGQEKYLKKVVLLGMSIPFFVYLIFMLVVVGNFGVGVQEIATLSLGRFFSVLGVLTMFTAFFTLSLAIRDMFRFDFKLGRFKGWLLCSLIPLALFLLVSFFKLASFIDILSFGGIVSGGMTGILILLMNLKAKKTGNRKPEYSVKINKFIIFLLSLIFFAAVILEIFFN
jgi:amino acid permease